MAGTLEQLLLRIVNQRGLDYLEGWAAAKKWWRETEEEKRKEEINKIERVEVFPYLFTLGLNLYELGVATTRWGYLEKGGK
jgi:hypothetical protein